MSKRRLVFETQTKQFFEGPEPSSLVENLRDSSDHQSMLNGRISEYFFQGLDHIGVPTHFIRRLNMRETLIEQSEMLSFSVLIRNRADEKFARAMDFDLGAILPKPMIEFHYHNAKGETQVLSRADVLNFDFANDYEMKELEKLALRVNDFLNGVYWSVGYFLVDLGLEFGRQINENYQPQILISDDIGPLQAQLWDVALSDENNIVRPNLNEVASRLGIQ